MQRIRSGQRTILAALVVAVTINLSSAAPPEKVRLPTRAVARIGGDHFYHGPGITSAALSPDGKCVASAASYPSSLRYLSEQDREAYARVVVLWDAATGERLRELSAPQRVAGLAFAPDGKQLAVSCKGCVALFDVQTGKQVLQLDCADPGRPQFSADGKTLHVCTGRKGVTSWEVASGNSAGRAKEPAGDDWIKERERILDASPSPDGKFVVWRLWQAIDYSKLPRGVRPPPADLRPTALVVTDAATDRPLYRHNLSTGAVPAVALAHDGKRLVVIAGARTSVYDVATDKELSTLDEPGACRVALAPNGRHAVLATSAAHARLWDLDTGKPVHELCRGLTYLQPETLETPQCFSADGKTLLLTTDSTLRLFDTTTGKERGDFPHHAPITPRFAPDGQTLLTTCDEARCRWKLAPDKAPALVGRDLRNAWEGVCGYQPLAHSADGRLFVDRKDNTIRLRDTKTGEVVRELEKEQQRSGAIFGLFSPDGARVLVHRLPLVRRDPEFYQLYDVKTGKVSGEISLAGDASRPVFSLDGRQVAWAARDNGVHLHDGATGKLSQVLRPARPLVPSDCNDAALLFAPDGAHLAVIAYKGHYGWEGKERSTSPILIYHVRSGKEVGRFYADPDRTKDGARLSCWAWSPDGRVLALAEQESGKVRLIEVESGQVRAELSGHRQGVRGLAFAPDGKTLVSGGEDNTVLLWDVTGARTGPVRKQVTEKELAAWWDDLAAREAPRADAAAGALLRAPADAVPFLAARLKVAEAPDDKQLARLIADLADKSFEKRKKARAELERLGGQAEAALRQALKDNPDPEAKRQIERLLEDLDQGSPQETLRAIRAVEVLEHAGTAEAITCLQALARGAASARQTVAAKDSLARLKAARP